MVMVVNAEVIDDARCRDVVVNIIMMNARDASACEAYARVGWSIDPCGGNDWNEMSGDAQVCV